MSQLISPYPEIILGLFQGCLGPVDRNRLMDYAIEDATRHYALMEGRNKIKFRQGLGSAMLQQTFLANL